MKIAAMDQANSLNLCDAVLTGIIWQNDYHDLAISLCLSSGAEAVIACEWFADLKMSVDLGDLVNLMTWEVRFTRSNDQRWHVEFDFGKDHIELNCYALTYEERRCDDCCKQS